MTVTRAGGCGMAACPPHSPRSAQRCRCPCRKMLRLCGEAEDRLAQELIHFELQVERDVIEPLFVLAEVSGGRGGPGLRVSPCWGLTPQTSPGDTGFCCSGGVFGSWPQ